MHEGIPSEAEVQSGEHAEALPFTETLQQFEQEERGLGARAMTGLKGITAAALVAMTGACTGMHVEYKSSFQSHHVTKTERNPHYRPSRTDRINLAPALRKVFGSGKNQRHSALEETHSDGTTIERTVLASEDGDEAATQKIVVKRPGMPDMELDLARFV